MTDEVDTGSGPRSAPLPANDPASSPKKLTVIVPVYNGATYLARCLDSLLAQEGFPSDDLEILLLDDGSTDSSGTIIDRYHQAHPQCVRGLQHPNMGVAATRNRGIDEARGVYVMFVDQDDWVDSTYCRTFYDAIVASGADVAYGGYRRPDEAGRVRVTVTPGRDFYARFIVVAAWAKIHSRAFLLEHGVRFLSNKYGEDTVFTVAEIAATSAWQHIDYVGYNWFFNTASVSNTSQQGLTPDDTAPLLTLLNEIRGAAAALRDTVEVRYYLLRTIVFYLLFSGRHSTPRDFVDAQSALFHWYKTHCGALSARELMGPPGETTQARMAILAMVIVDRLRLTALFARIYCRPQPKG